MWVSNVTEDRLTDGMIDRLLFEGLEDSGESADCIIVLGSTKATEYRVPAAVRAYQAGRSEKIMLCGGNVRIINGERISEAENMRRKALSLGVSEEHIINEEYSQNTGHL